MNFVGSQQEPEILDVALIESGVNESDHIHEKKTQGPDSESQNAVDSREECPDEKHQKPG